MNELKQKKLEEISRSNPFTVPDGYFEKLQANVMSRLPEETREQSVSAPKKFIHLSWRPFAAAAVVCGVLLGAATYWHNVNTQSAEANALAATEAYDLNDTEISSDYIIMDNEMLYSFLSEY